MAEFELVTPVFAGYITYHPWFGIGTAEKSDVQEWLVNSGTLEGVENFEIVLDWRFVKADKDENGAMSNREDAYIALCHDGGDWEQGKYFFLMRKGLVDDRELYIHVPDEQAALEGASRWISTGEAEVLIKARTLAVRVVRQADLWHRVTFYQEI